MKTLILTNHAIKRTSQRGISHTQMEICMSFGERINKTGTEFYVLTKKCLKRLKKHTESFKTIKRKKKFKSSQLNKNIY